MKVNDFILSESTGNDQGSVTCGIGNGFILTNRTEPCACDREHPHFALAWFLFLFFKKRGVNTHEANFNREVY